MRWWMVSLLATALGCAASKPAEVSVAPAAEQQTVAEASAVDDAATVSWTALKAEVESVLCPVTHDVPDYGTMVAPSYGVREACGLEPAQTDIQHAVVEAFEKANGALISLGDERQAAFIAAQLPDEAKRLEALRAAYLTPRFLGVLLPRLNEALHKRGLTCEGCPSPERPPLREVTWAQYQPYLLAHVWPDPVITPRDDAGRALGEARVSVHICGGINGLATMPEPDAQLVQAGYLGAFHTAPIRDRVTEFMDGLESDQAYDALKTDEERTAYLREQIGPHLLADTKIQPSVCATLEQYRADTGVVVTECQR